MSTEHLDPVGVHALQEARRILGRKLVAEDLADGGEVGTTLYDLATAWLPTQIDVDFDWLATIAERYARGGGLTDRQAAGVLNCLYAALSRDGQGGAPSALPNPYVTAIPAGYYTVLFGDRSHRTLRVSDWMADKRAPGREVRWVSLLTGPNNDEDYSTVAMQRDDGSYVWMRALPDDGRVRQAVELVTDPENDHARSNAREAYAMQSGRCANCNRRLTVPASLHRGLGPDCAAKLGLDDDDDEEEEYPDAATRPTRDDDPNRLPWDPEEIAASEPPF